MSFLKHDGKILVFLFAAVVVFWLSGDNVFAITESQCINDKKGECRANTNDPEDPSNVCGSGYVYKAEKCDDNSGKPFCCIEGGITKAACRANSGDCQPSPCGSGYRANGKCMASDGGGYCCIPTGANNESQCKCGDQLGQCSKPGDLCPTGMKQFGTCGTEGGITGGRTQHCCIPESCTATPTSGSSGTAALNYTPLENLPGFESGGGDFASYFKSLYSLALWIVGISALFMLVVGGFLYLSSAGNTSLLGTAKKTIYSALIGIVIALVSWLLLDTINSDLTNLKLSGLSGADGTGGATTPSTPLGATPPAGSGSGCSGIPTQSGIDAQCGDASQSLSDALKCMADKVGAKKLQLSSISDSAGFSRCQTNHARPPCAHAQNSCHYGGSSKASKSCAADISTGGSSASGSDIKTAARGCGVPFVNDEGNHIHISVAGCACDGHN